VIDPATLLAYRQTEYRVLGEVPAVLRVGVHCPQLAMLHQLHQTHCSAFVTACNPLGVLADEALNAQRQEALRAQIKVQRHVAIAGLGQHPAGGWPPEPSYLVLDISRDAAQRLGNQFEQNAILWADGDAIPELILLR
jgi:hypothetical protein